MEQISPLTSQHQNGFVRYLATQQAQRVGIVLATVAGIGLAYRVSQHSFSLATAAVTLYSVILFRLVKYAQPEQSAVQTVFEAHRWAIQEAKDRLQRLDRFCLEKRREAFKVHGEEAFNDKHRLGLVFITVVGSWLIYSASRHSVYLASATLMASIAITERLAKYGYPDRPSSITVVEAHRWALQSMVTLIKSKVFWRHRQPAQKERESEETLIANTTQEPPSKLEEEPLPIAPVNEGEPEDPLIANPMQEPLSNTEEKPLPLPPAVDVLPLKNRSLRISRDALQQSNWQSAYQELMTFFATVKEDTSIEEMKEACSLWEQMILFLPPKKMEDLRDRGFQKALIHFPQLSEQQLNLALKFGHWYLEQKDPISEEAFFNSMHFYAQALKITTQHPHRQREVHCFSSRLLFRFLLQHLYNRIDRAYRSHDVTQVSDILNSLESLSCFCTNDSEVEQLYITARSIFNNKSTLSRDFQPFLERLQADIEQIPKASENLVTEKYRKGLEAFRQWFHQRTRSVSSTSMREMQKEISHQFIQFFRETLLEDALMILGPPPCEYEMQAMGSLARDELSPFSDLEWFILIEKEEHREYFRQLALIIELQIISLGETAATDLPVFSCLGVQHASGLHVDTGGNPAHVDDLIQTPEKLAALQKPQMATDGDPCQTKHTLRKSIGLSTNSVTLFRRYTEEMKKVLSEEARKNIALALLKNRIARYREKFPTVGSMPPTIHLKNHFVELITFCIQDLGFYFDVQKCNPLEVVQKLVKQKVFTAPSGQMLQEVLGKIYIMRVNAHFSAGQQHEEVIDQDVVTALHKAYWVAIHPLYQALDYLLELGPWQTPIDLQHYAFLKMFGEQKKDDLDGFLPSLVPALISINVPYEEHEKYYLALSEQSIFEECRATYLKMLQGQPFYERLSFIPNRGGFRQSFRLAEERLEADIRDCVTSQQPSSDAKVIVNIRLASDNPNSNDDRYLLPDAVEKIFDENGDIRKEYGDSLHRVARLKFRGHDLHFKQCPSHPMMEYAVRALTNRMMGQATPAVTLARLVVKVADKEKEEYPVLISQTIDGEPLSERVSVDPVNLTWTLLCTLLTRPGDGRFSNYVIKQMRIFCIDNDISFVEPIVREEGKNKVDFCLILFCLYPEFILKKEALEKFCELQLNLILANWVDDLLKKEETFSTLFPVKDMKPFYEQDPALASVPSVLLLREGSLMTICLQFAHLQQVIQAKLRTGTPIRALDLLSTLITLRNNGGQSEIGPHVQRAYQNSLFVKGLKERLRIATNRRYEQSMTTPQALETVLGKILSFDEIRQRENYSLEKAKKELLLFSVERAGEGVSFSTQGEKGTLSVLFKEMTVNGKPDIERHLLILKGLAFYFSHLSSKKAPLPTHLTLPNTPALNTETLRPLLHRGIVSLDLRNCPSLKDDDIRMLATMVKDKGCDQLEELYLSRCTGLRNLDDASGLFDLIDVARLGSTPLSFPKLRILHVARCDLRWLKLNAPNLQDLKANNNPRLQVVMFPPPKMNFSGCNYLESGEAIFKFLHESHFRAKMGKLSWETLVKLYQNSPQLSTLNLNDSNITYIGMSALVSALQENTSLCTLDLSDNRLRAKSITKLATFLRGNTSLNTLNLSNTMLGDEEIECLAEALAFNRALVTLNLSDNAIGDCGFAALARALCKNRSIQSLDVSNNSIQSMRTLADALSVNTTLQELNLSRNMIKEAQVLSKAVESNTTLLVLDLSKNHIVNCQALNLGSGNHAILTGQLRHRSHSAQYSRAYLNSVLKSGSPTGSNSPKEI